MAVSWQRVLKDTYSFKPRCLTHTTSSGDPLLLPFTEVDSWLNGKRAVALPFLDDCPILDSQSPEYPELLTKLKEEGKKRGWKKIVLKGGRPSLPGIEASTVYYGHSIPLQRCEKELFASLRSSTRRAIRKAKKNGVVASIGTEESLVKEYYRLQCLTRKRHGLPPQTYSFFKNVHKHIIEAGKGLTIICRYQGLPIAGAIYFHHEHQAFYKFGASDMRFQHVRGNNLVMWTAIKHFAQQGYDELNLGRTSISNEGLRFFKASWAAKEEQVEYFCYDLKKDQFVGREELEGGWHNLVFQNLPIWASRIVGWALYKHMA